MKKEIIGKPVLSIALAMIMVFSMLVAVKIVSYAATEAEIQQAIEDGLEWLVTQQNSNTADPNYGSWSAYYGELEAGTGLALYKLCDRAYELGYESPFDSGYEYNQNVSHGFDWLFDHLAIAGIGLQDHTTGATGTVDDPDTNMNGQGVCTRRGSTRETYCTGILLAAVAASGTPTRLVNVASSPVNGWTYGQVAQDMVDFLAFSQVDPAIGPGGGIHEGGWDYLAVDNSTGGTSWKGDQSNSGYAVLGLGEAEGFGCTIPGWVKTELSVWIDWVQDDFTGDANDGGSWYSYPGDYIGVNILKTGNLIFEMALVGDVPTTQRVTNATDYLARHWNDASGVNQPPGWNGTVAQYQAMFCAMKGLEYMGIDTFGSIDWFEDFSDAIVAQQDKTPGPTYGSWQSSSGRGEPVIITEWALLTLEKVAPPHRTVDKKVYVELLKNGDFSSGLDCWKVRVEKGNAVQVYDGPTWLATRPLGPGWTDVNLINEVGRTNVLDIIQAVSDGDGDWTGVYQTPNRDVTSFSELYFEADGKAMFQSLAGDGWVGGEYPVHFIVQYEDVNGVQHDTWLGWPPNPAWQQGFYYLAGNLPNEPYSNIVTQNAWFHYKSPNLMNLSPAPKIIKTVRLYSSGWAYHGRIDNAQLYGTPPSAELGDVIHVEVEVFVPLDETVTVVDTLPTDVQYCSGTFTVDGDPATPTITKNRPPPPIITEISYTITDGGTYMIEFDCKVDMAYWEDREVCNVATATWFSEEAIPGDCDGDGDVDDDDIAIVGAAYGCMCGDPCYDPRADLNDDCIVDAMDLAIVNLYYGTTNVIETKEDVECFTIHPFEQLHKNVGIPKADVVFAIDLTGSMGDEIAEVKANATNIMNSLAAQIADVQFGLISYMDYDGTYSTTAPGSVPLTYTAQYGSAASGDYPYMLDQDITSNIPVMTAKINGLTLGWGADGPQDYTRIIHEAYNDSNLHWRTDAKKILILFGDDVPHDTDFDNNIDGTADNTGGDPGRDTVLGTVDDLDFETEVANAAANGVHVMAVYSGWAGQKYPWIYMANLTGGEYFELTEAEQIPDAVKDLIKRQAEETLTIKEKTEVQWAVVMDVVNPFCYTMKNVTIKDNFGAELEIDQIMASPDTNGDGVIDISDLVRVGMNYGTFALFDQDQWDPVADINRDGVVDMRDLTTIGMKYGITLWLTGKSDKVHLFWYIGDLAPGETARIILLVSTDLNPAGHQEYTEPGVYEMNSGATLKFIDPLQDVQLSAVTDSIYVTVLPLEDP